MSSTLRFIVSSKRDIKFNKKTDPNPFTADLHNVAHIFSINTLHASAQIASELAVVHICTFFVVYAYIRVGSIYSRVGY